MYSLFDAGSGDAIGKLTEKQLQFLIDQLEEESLEDQDYYINIATLAMFENKGADAELMTMLRTAMGDRQEMDIRWSRAN